MFSHSLYHLSDIACLICGPAEEERTDAVCFTQPAVRTGSWWILQEKTHQSTNPHQTASAGRAHLTFKDVRFNLIKNPTNYSIERSTHLKLCLVTPDSTDSIGSAFTFDFRNPSRMKRPFHVGSGKANRSAESSPVECNGTKTSELQLRIQSQQEEINRLQEQENNLREELASQKVQ